MSRSTRYLLVCCLLLGVLPQVAARPSQQGAQAIITSPQPNATVRGLVVVKGTATIDSFQFFKVEFGRGANPGEWQIVGSTRPTPVSDGVLAQWDTTALPDGVYSLRLQVVKNDGNYQEYFVRQLVVANKRPTETATPSQVEEKPTTPAPTVTLGPTATLAILQPTAAIAQPTPTPTPVRPVRGATLPQLPVKAWRDAFCMGVGTMGAIFVVLGVVLALRRIL